MKKNKENRIFSCVLSRLACANFYRARNENEYAYREVLVAKRLIAGFGGDDVKVDFYEREYYIMFTLHECRDRLNRYSVSASHGYENDYHDTNKSHVNALISSAEFVRYCGLRRDFRDYQFFLHVADDVLYWGLSGYDYRDYYNNGKIEDIPFDVAVNLCRKLRDCLGDIANEAIAHKKVVL